MRSTDGGWTWPARFAAFAWLAARYRATAPSESRMPLLQPPTTGTSPDFFLTAGFGIPPERNQKHRLRAILARPRADLGRSLPHARFRLRLGASQAGLHCPARWRSAAVSSRSAFHGGAAKNRRALGCGLRFARCRFDLALPRVRSSRHHPTHTTSTAITPAQSIAGRRTASMVALRCQIDARSMPGPRSSSLA